MTTGSHCNEVGPMNKQRREVDLELLKILVCPMTRTALVYDEAAQELISRAAGAAYPIRNGIPVMLIEEVRKL